MHELVDLRVGREVALVDGLAAFVEPRREQERVAAGHSHLDRRERDRPGVEFDAEFRALVREDVDVGLEGRVTDVRDAQTVGERRHGAERRASERIRDPGDRQRGEVDLRACHRSPVGGVHDGEDDEGRVPHIHLEVDELRPVEFDLALLPAPGSIVRAHPDLPKRLEAAGLVSPSPIRFEPHVLRRRQPAFGLVADHDRRPRQRNLALIVPDRALDADFELRLSQLPADAEDPLFLLLLPRGGVRRESGRRQRESGCPQEERRGAAEERTGGGGQPPASSSAWRSPFPASPRLVAPRL